MKKLSRNEMKALIGGRAAELTSDLGAAGPCDSCSRICYSNSGGYGYGNCNTLPSGEQSGCHNYCCATSSTYWC